MNKKVIQLLKNVVSFYTLYAKEAPLQKPKSSNVLDTWIRAKLAKLIMGVESSMDVYDINTAVRDIMEFIDELSTWYVRRSRTRVKSDSGDKDAALFILYFVLLELSKIVAPFAPFLAEYVYKEIGGTTSSVHLEDWPTIEELFKEKNTVLLKMEATRQIVSLGLSKRAEAGIKVRQPLAAVCIYDEKQRLNKTDVEYLELIQEELNVLEVRWDNAKHEETLVITLDTDWQGNSELVALGQKRDIVRYFNALRKNMGFSINDIAEGAVVTQSEEIKNVVRRFQDGIMKETCTFEIKEEKIEGACEKEIKINDIVVLLQIKKR